MTNDVNEMTPARLAQLLAERASMRRERDPARLRADLEEAQAKLAELRERAETAEAEASDALADLAEVTAERNTLKHCFSLLANRIFGGSSGELPPDDGPRDWLDICVAELERHEQNRRTVARVIDAVDAHKRAG
jgi:hypothetical protein